MSIKSLALTLFNSSPVKREVEATAIAPISQLPAVLTPTATISLQASPYYPALKLFAAKKDAQLRAQDLGAPWVPVAFACGYLITNGWHFQDANGLLETFCPVPHNVIEVLQDLVTELQKPLYAPKDCPAYINKVLKDIPFMQTLPRAYYEAVCFCTVMRIGYAAPSDKPDDWLTVPAWALRLKRRRARLFEGGLRLTA